jgi:uncharacterized membrane protein (UPF0127 family)
MASFLSPILRAPGVSHTLVHQGTGAVVADRVVGAFDSASRRKGLLGLDSMPAGEALIIAPSNAVHTFFMRFAIDVAFAARDGRIVKVCSAVPARRLCIAWRGFAAIELAAGSLSAAGVTVGDFVCVNPASR